MSAGAIRCVVLFSGGLDSATAAIWAKKEFDNIIAINFSYEQKHQIETEMAKKFSRHYQIPLLQWQLDLASFLKSPLLQKDAEIASSLRENLDQNSIPKTYVPFRNGIFLSLAAAYAESNDCYELATGFNLIDSCEYPDTTPDFVSKMEQVLNSGTACRKRNKKFVIHTPLLTKTKAEIIRFGLDLGLDYSLTYSCYRGTWPPCQSCPSCLLRARGFKEADLNDPLLAKAAENFS